MRLGPGILQAPRRASKNRVISYDGDNGGEMRPCKRAGVADFRLFRAKAGQ